MKLSHESVSRHLSAAVHWLGSIYDDLSFTTDQYPLVRRARRASVKKLPDEARSALLKSEARVKLPAFEGMPEEIYRITWLAGTTAGNSFRVYWLRALWISFAPMICTGCRPSNVSRTKASHTGLAKECSWCTDAQGVRVWKYTRLVATRGGVHAGAHVQESHQPAIRQTFTAESL
jgi:hypothetical protein